MLSAQAAARRRSSATEASAVDEIRELRKMVKSLRMQMSGVQKAVRRTSMVLGPTFPSNPFLDS